MALVYSTDHGRTCPGCRQSLTICVCKAAKPVPAGDGIVRVSREKQGRGGKTVTVVRGLMLDAIALTTTGKQLRAACGAGGTAKDGVIEVQGDHVERVMTWLTQAGHRVRRAGGDAQHAPAPSPCVCGRTGRPGVERAAISQGQPRAPTFQAAGLCRHDRHRP
jgi:translation initiation factor 1